MGLVKKNIHMNKLKGKIVTQITLDDDVIVPDRLPDINNKITENSNILVDSVKVSQNKINVVGKLKFNLMYKSASPEIQIHKLDGFMNFDENVNMEGIEDGDTINVDFDIDDLSISVINSRKVSVKAIISVTAIAENISDEEMVVDMEGDNAEYIKDNIDLTQIALRKKDLLRVKEEIDLGNGKQNVNDIIWSNASLFSTQSKVLEDKVNISGEIVLFVLYTSTEGQLQWMDANVPFNGMIEIPGCNEEMIPSIELKLSNADIDAKPDFDGEQRLLQLDGIVNVDIKLYEEQHLSIIKDIYSREKDMCAKTKVAEYENLLMKNITKNRASQKIKVNLDNAHIMQVCSCCGEVKIDDISIVEDGIMVEGIVDVSIIYICSDDSNPLCCTRESIPFSQKIDVNGINENSVYKIKSYLEQLQGIMTGSDEIEIKAVISLDCIVFDKIQKDVMYDIEVKDYDMDKISNMPAIVGYIVQKGDSLWSIAKNFYTTVDSIKSVNEITNGEVTPGDMIVIVKKMIM